jgi:uncharacterized membrane protein YebE (DUF533 family)
MFDARSILDILLGGGPQRQGRPADPTVFKDMLDQLGDQPSAPGARRPTVETAPQPAPGGRYTQSPTGQPGQPSLPGGMSLEDLLRAILTGTLPQRGAQEPGPAGGRQAAPGGQTGPPIGPEVSKELQDLLRQILQGGSGQSGGQSGGATKIPVNRIMEEGGAESTKAGASGLGEALRQVLGQATADAREGAAKIDEATGISGRTRDALEQATGQTPEELVAKLKKLIAENQIATGAVLGGLGALVLGTRAGRSLAGTAIRLGSSALIGGLAYKAYQSYQQGRPIISTDQPGERQALVPAPEGTGFEPGAVTNDAARLYIRAMIAAAAADGRIDGAEQQKILGGLRQAGIEDAAEQFLAAEISNPATVSELAAGVHSPEEAVQVYTAARIAVDPDDSEEHAFLSSLAEALGIDDELAAQVDATARNV